MAGRPHIAAVMENVVNTRIEALLRRRGWTERLIGYTSYGTAEQVRVLARVVLSRHEHPEDAIASVAASKAEQLDAERLTLRGWRAFVTAPALSTPVTIELGGARVEVLTDRGGYVDTVVTGHGLAPGWHEVTMAAGHGAVVTAPVLVVEAGVERGVVSDIDDTVMITHLPRILIAAWNTFMRSEQAREVVPGMAALMRSLLAEKPGSPVFYLSTGAWNTAPTLARFLKRHDFPAGPLLLTDWGPTNTGWFRSGQQHKTDQLHRLLRDFPGTRWILIGDDGQHDPAIYGTFAEQHPEAVEVVAIRQLTPTQQVLSHGLPIATDELLGQRHNVPMLRAPDGYQLHRLIHRARQMVDRA